MPGVLVLYDSHTGRTESIARRIADALREQGLDVACKMIQETSVDELLDVDGVIIGSPTYYGTMSAETKRFLDESVRHHTKLDGKIGAAFATAGSTGQETTVLSILQALLIHGMIIQGDCSGLHYGVTSVGDPDAETDQRCVRFARRYAGLIHRLC